MGHVHSVPGFVLRSALGRVAYFVGRRHRRLPRSLCRRLSSFSTWWGRPDAAGDVPTRVGQWPARTGSETGR
jgi:hypothetical protein